MKIAIIVPALQHKGPVIVAKDLCEKFCECGHVCEVFYFKEHGTESFPCKTTKISLLKDVDFSKFDVIHSHCLLPALYVWLKAQKIGISKVVVTLHQPITYYAYRLANNAIKARILSAISKRIYSSFRNIVVLSKVQASLIRPFIQRDVKIIYNGRDVCVGKVSDSNNVLAIEKLAKQYNIVGTTSVIVRGKGLEQMVKALTQLPNCAFVCVGSGPELEPLKQLSCSLGVDDRCLWLGYQSDAVNYLPYFDVYVMCTRSEGFPLAFIEAAGAHCSCVLSDIENLKCIVPDDYVHFYQLDNIDSLVSNIQSAIDNKEMYGARLYEYYKNNLTATVMASNYLDLFNNINK